MKLLENYKSAVTAIHEYFSYKEDWRVLPIEDYTDCFWQIEGDEVWFAESKEDLETKEGSCCTNELYRRSGIYRKKDYTAICINTCCGGNIFFAVFNSDLEVK